MRPINNVHGPMWDMLWEASAVAYVLPNVFSVAGVNRTSVYTPGTLVFNPINKKVAAVLFSEYSGGNTQVFLAKGILASGLVSVAYYSESPALVNLCTGGTALSGGYYSTLVPAYAFDGSAFNTTMAVGAATAPDQWVCSQTGAGINGVAWLGYQFASALKIRWFNLLQVPSTTNYGYLTSVLFQYSDNGSAWTTHATVTLSNPAGFNLLVCDEPAATHAYWRILANSASSANWWGVFQLQMGV